MATAPTIIAQGRTDDQDRLLSADEPLAGLQQRCGGEIPGVVAVPQLLELVRKARTLGLRLARTVEAFDGVDTIRAWFEITPDGEEPGGCFLEIGAWQAMPRAAATDAEEGARKLEIDRSVAELTARLDSGQGVLTVDARASDLEELAKAMQGAPGRPWFEHVVFPEISHRQPVHWRLLDGARCEVPGSARGWTVTMVPLGQPDSPSAGFELLLIADRPLRLATPPPAETNRGDPTFGSDLTPVLRQPITRIIANAETIRARLAGPIADEYSNYAADIAAAGQHLLALIEDLSDLEIVESDDFTTAPDPIDLGDVARRAVGILGVRAHEKGIDLVAPADDAVLPAIGEFRRVLQVLLNVVGNAIRYSPRGSAVVLTLEARNDRSLVLVTDQGPGLKPAQQQAVFEKFERLGRSDDGGSGLGLYISRRLARAMNGDLTVESVPGRGTTFALELPAR